MNQIESTMKHLPQDMRPYEKATHFGVHTLSDTELLSIIIRSGTIGHTALETAGTVLQELGGLGELLSPNLSRLQRIPGIGAVKLLQLSAVGELSRRVWRSSKGHALRFTSPSIVYDYFKEELRHIHRETVLLLSLDNRCHMLYVSELSKGSANVSVFSPRDIFSEAIAHNAAGFILLHNHPSGDPTPSTEDIEITQTMFRLGKMMQLPLMDHVIIGDTTYVSLKELGYMNGEETP